MPDRHEVCPVRELPPGERRIVEVEGLSYSIGVFNVDGEYHALANVCPHQLGPLCEGRITGESASESVGDFQLVRTGEVIQCPWHGWKFNIEDGTSVFNPHALSAPSFETAVEKPQRDGEKSQDRVEGEKSGKEIEEEVEEYGTALAGEEPPVDTYPVEVEEDVVVVYV